MAKEAKLLVVLDEKGIHTEIKGSISDVMFMAERALTECREALEKVEAISHEDAVKMMEQPIKSYQTEAEFGAEAAMLRVLMELMKRS